MNFIEGIKAVFGYVTELRDEFYRRHTFLGAFAKLRKATISFVISVRPSVVPRGTVWLPLDRVS